MVDLIPEEKVRLFLDCFNSLADSDGILQIKCLGNLLRSVGENPTKEELQDMINWVDKDASGIVKFPDFLYMMASKIDSDLEEIDIREAFTIFDNDGNGQVTRTELRHVMMNMGEKLSEEECDFLVDEADTDGDGSINFEEFVSMMKSAGHYSKVDGSWQLSESKSNK